MMALTPEEIKFFETGDASNLKVDPVAAPTPAPAPAPVDPLSMSGLGNEPVAAPVAAPIAAPVVAPVVAPAPSPDVAEVLRRSLAEAQQQLADLQAQQRQAQKPPVVEPPAPDPTVDPLGAVMHNLTTLQKQIESLKQSQAQTLEQQENQRAFTAFQGQVRELRDNFVKTAPDFPEAYNYLRETRAADLKAMGLNDSQVAETLFREEITLAQNAIRNARNPAEVAYETAKRHGWKPTAAPAPGLPPGAPVAAPAGGPDAAAIARAQAASRQLPASTPAGSDVALTMEGLRAASDADLNKIVLNDAEWKRFTGAGQYPL
jgi:hypothetical protein